MPRDELFGFTRVRQRANLAKCERFLPQYSVVVYRCCTRTPDAPSTSGLLLGLTVCRRLRFTCRILDCIDFVGFSKTVLNICTAQSISLPIILCLYVFFFKWILNSTAWFYRCYAVQPCHAANGIFSLKFNILGICEGIWVWNCSNYKHNMNW